MKDIFYKITKLELHWKLIIFAVIISVFTKGVGTTKKVSKRGKFKALSLFVVSTIITFTATFFISEVTGYKSVFFLMFTMTITSLFSSGFAEGLIALSEQFKNDPWGLVRNAWKTFRGEGNTVKNDYGNDDHHIE